MLTTEQPSTRRSRVVIAVAFVAVVLLAAAVRFLFIDEVSGDYRTFLSPWYDQLSAGGFKALGGDFSNYNPPYLYLILFATHLPLPKIVAIKVISMVFDVVLASFAALIVRELVAHSELGRRDPVGADIAGRRWRISGQAAPLVCFGLVLFAPTVLVNSSWWGQCDSIYAAFCLGSLFLLIRDKPWWACGLFGLALSFKLQAIFFLPVLIIVLVVNRRRGRAGWNSLLALLTVPVVFCVMLLPALLAGRDLSSLLSIYPDQISTGGTAAANGGGSGGQFAGAAQGARGVAGVGGTVAGGPRGGGGGYAARGFGQAAGSSSLTQNAPTFYQWLGANASTLWKYVGFAAAAAVGLFVGGLALLRRRPLTAPEIVVVATTIVLAVPFFLPQMHERYFYLADVLTMVMAFCVRRYWVVAIIVSACSLLCYAPFLMGRTIVPLPVVAVAEFIAVVTTLVVCWKVLRPGSPRPEVNGGIGGGPSGGLTAHGGLPTTANGSTRPPL